MNHKFLEVPVTVLQRHRFTVYKAELTVIEFGKERPGSTVQGTITRTVHGWEYRTVCHHNNGAFSRCEGTELELLAAVHKVCFAEGQW